MQASAPPPPPTCRVVRGLRQLPIPRIDAANLSLADFRTRFSQPSRPVILVGAMRDWPATARWSTEYISSLCGTRRLEQECADAKHRYVFRTQLKRFNRSLNGQAWASLQDVDASAAGLRTVDDLLRAQRDDPALYLHDQSINLFCPALLDDVRAPRYFPVDFLRQVPSSDARQGRPSATSCALSWHPSIFVGRSGTESGLHADSMSTRFWMGVVRGTKQFRLASPADARDHLYPLDPGVTALDMGHYSGAFGVDLFRPNLRLHPRLREARVWEGNVSAGDLIFIPEMWAHQVINQPGEDTLAISYNFVDEVNFEEHLRSQYHKMASDGDAGDERGANTAALRIAAFQLHEHFPVVTSAEVPPDHADEPWRSFFARNQAEEQAGWDQPAYLAALKANLRSPCAAAAPSSSSPSPPIDPISGEPIMPPPDTRIETCTADAAPRRGGERAGARLGVELSQRAAVRSGMLQGLFRGEAAMQLVFARLLAAIAGAVVREAALRARWEIHRQLYARPKRRT